MNLIKIAWRNIWRNKLRSIAVILSVILGILAGIFSSALVDGMLKGRLQNFIEKEVSHIQIHHPKFIGQQEVGHISGYPVSALDEVVGNEEVLAATLRTKIQCMIASATFTGGVQIQGILPDFEHLTTGFSDNLIEGDYLNPNDKNAVLLGRALADKMKVRIGSRIVLTFQDVNNDIVSAAFTVKGLYQTAYRRFDENNAYVPLQYLNEYLGIDDSWHEMAILTTNGEDLSEIQKELQLDFPDLKVRQWIEVSPELSVWVASGSMFSYIFVIVILIGLAFGLLNTMLMSVFERTREIGMLMAIGMNKRKVFMLIVWETIALSLVGAVVGMVSGYFFVSWLSRVGIDLSSFSDVMQEIGFETSVFPILDWTFFMVLPFGVMITAVLAAIYPALKALSLNPAEAVRK